MFSQRLVQLIESHSDGLAQGVVRRLRGDRRAPTVATLPESELYGQCQHLLKRLGDWLAESREAEIARHYEELGRIRWREDVPLHEAVHALHVLKRTMVDYARAQGFAQTASDVYGEEELEHAIGQFFDSAVYHLVHGYETSRRKVASAGV